MRSSPSRIAEGYTTDDNARALIFAVLLEQLGQVEPINAVAISRFPLPGISGACFNPANGSFGTSSATIAAGTRHRDRKIVTDARCGHSELFWDDRKITDCRGAAGRLFEFSVPAALEFHSPRAWAFTLLGIQEYLDSFPGDRDAQSMSSIAHVAA